MKSSPTARRSSTRLAFRPSRNVVRTSPTVPTSLAFSPLSLTAPPPSAPSQPRLLCPLAVCRIPATRAHFKLSPSRSPTRALRGLAPRLPLLKPPASPSAAGAPPAHYPRVSSQGPLSLRQRKQARRRLPAPPNRPLSSTLPLLSQQPPRALPAVQAALSAVQAALPAAQAALPTA